jgi:hypothetical protein
LPLRRAEYRWRKSLTQESNTEGTENLDESTVDSPVIKALRRQIKDLEKAVSTAPTRESVEAEIRESLARESAISSQLVALGHPAGLSEFLKGKLGDAEVTRDSVAAALTGIGYAVDVDGASSESGVEVSAQQSDLAKVANLSAQVRSAALGGTSDDLARKISQAQSQAELNALMEEAGLTAQLH